MYYLHSILHDWDDENARKILFNQIPAMEKEYSKLLINEMIVPETKAASLVAGFDIAMMALLAGMERTLMQWQNLLKSVGLQIVMVWQVNETGESVIEAELI